MPIVAKQPGHYLLQLILNEFRKHLRQKPQQFIDQYLRIDEDKDYVLQSVPCTFLDSDNTCFIYDVRPKACREFPHTDRKKFQQISDLTLKECGNLSGSFQYCGRNEKENAFIVFQFLSNNLNPKTASSP